jgi:hypothetical protein
MKRVHVLYAGLCFCLSQPVAAQNDSDSRTSYLELGTGLAFHQVKDDALSPVRYRGVRRYWLLGGSKTSPAANSSNGSCRCNLPASGPTKRKATCP